MRRSRYTAWAALVTLGLGGAGMTRAAVSHQAAAPAPTSPATYTVTAGFGDRGGVANIFAPRVVAIYAGDTVTWTVGGELEPHTVSFGPQPLLDRLAAGFIAAVPQKAGPPLLALNPKVALASGGPTFSEGGMRSRLSLARFVEVFSTNPARILGLYPRKGAIAPGSDADLVIWDPHCTRTIRLADLHHDGDYSIWEGWTVQGWPVTTILRGKVMVEDGRLHGISDDGRFVKRKMLPRR